MAATDILRALQEAQMQPIESGYGMGANVIGSLGGAAMNPRRSSSANIGIGVGSALLQGLLSGLARRDAAAQNAGMYEDFKRYQAGDESAVANNPRLQPLAMAMAAAKEEAAAKQAADLQKLELELQTKQKYETPFETKLSQAAALQEAKERVKAQYRPAKEAADPSEKLWGEADKRRAEFTSLPIVKDFAIIENAATGIFKAIQDDSAVSDLELVRAGIQIIEPGMAVREGEQAAAINSQSIPEAWKGEINKALSGGTALSPQVREGLKALAKRRYETAKGQYDRTYKNFEENVILPRGLDPKQVFTYIGQSRSIPDLMAEAAGKSGQEKTAPDLQSLSDEQLDALIAAKSQK